MSHLRGLPEPVAVLGLGLIGGSLALDLRACGVEVVGWDRGAVLRRARRRGLVGVAGASLEEAARRSRLVVLAGPPAVNLRWLRRLARLAPRGPIVTDVGSVKGPIVAEAGRLGFADFVGGHPVAGAERSGLEAARPGLFAGRAWALTPGAGTSRGALRAATALARGVGARPCRLAAGDHDRALAFLSHLPQLVAWALLAAARSDARTRRHLHLAGPGFEDMTRLAGSPRRLWRQILAENEAAVALAQRAFLRRLAPATRRPSGHRTGW